MRIAYLASTVTLPGPGRRVDAHEHDQMVDALTGPFARHGLTLEAVAWDDPDVDWSGYALAMIGTTWDYWDRAEAFLDRLEHIGSVTRLHNPAALVRWNLRKTYLRDLERQGVRTVPSVWLDVPTPDAVRDAFDALDTREIVVKRQIGAGADGQHRLMRGDAVPPMVHPCFAQPFLPSILDEGELSFIYVDGSFCHALVKRPTAGDYRIQAAYGGIEEAIEPCPADRDTARAVLDALPSLPLYARVDLVRGNDGELLLMELELIEPFLYPLQGPALGERLASAVWRRVGA